MHEKRAGNNRSVLQGVLFFLQQPGKDAIQGAGCLGCLALDLVAVGAEGVHVAAVAHNGFNLPFWQHLCHGHKGVAQLVGGPAGS